MYAAGAGAGAGAAPVSLSLCAAPSASASSGSGGAGVLASSTLLSFVFSCSWPATDGHDQNMLDAAVSLLWCLLCRAPSWPVLVLPGRLILSTRSGISILRHTIIGRLGSCPTSTATATATATAKLSLSLCIWPVSTGHGPECAGCWLPSSVSAVRSSVVARVTWLSFGSWPGAISLVGAEGGVASYVEPGMLG